MVPSARGAGIAEKTAHEVHPCRHLLSTLPGWKKGRLKEQQQDGGELTGMRRIISSAPLFGRCATSF